jgi:POT family proton-dependent oligopeptide transporter
MVPIFTFIIYPVMGRFFTLTPLRKIGIGLFVIASSYLIVASIENHIMHGETVSLWWQILAYVVLSAAEVMISITALEFSYRQAPLKVKSFIMAATYLLAVSIGNAFTAQVNGAMVKPLPTINVTTGAQTWAQLHSTADLQRGQKIDFAGDNGIKFTADDGQSETLEGTFLIGEIDAAHNRVRLIDAIHRKPVAPWPSCLSSSQVFTASAPTFARRRSPLR